MAQIAQTHSSAQLLAHSAAALPGAVLRRSVETLLAWQHRALERHQLASLSDYDLKDMGMTRTDAVVEAEKPFWQK